MGSHKQNTHDPGGESARAGRSPGSGAPGRRGAGMERPGKRHQLHTATRAAGIEPDQDRAKVEGAQRDQRQGNSWHAHFLLKSTYTPEGLKGLIQDGGARRVEVTRSLVENARGQLTSLHFAFAEADTYALCELPDHGAAAALAIAVGAARGLRVQITPLLSAAEVDEAADRLHPTRSGQPVPPRISCWPGRSPPLREMFGEGCRRSRKVGHVMTASWLTRPAAGGQPAGRRPLTRLTVVSLAGHVAFELGAGVGMPLASLIGPYAAAGFWTLVTAGVLAASTDDESADPLLAAANGFGIAAVSAHLLGWPTRRTRTGLPWLEDCEGLGPELMRYYNPILYLSGAAGLLAIARENRTARRYLPLAMLGLAPALVAF
ncbi:hypothetical protein B0E53_02054 [Micromonospora sp. MH33]|nr:hypothetical protein B0E53_02054 [Micromonospora sp. MH33]